MESYQGKTANHPFFLTTEAQRAEQNLAPFVTLLAGVGQIIIRGTQLHHGLIEGLIEAISGERVPMERILALRPEEPVAAPRIIHSEQKIGQNRTQTRNNFISLQCVSWLTSIDPNGDMRRKALAAKAREQFGPNLTDRMFSAAYKAAFNRPIGRPRKQK